MKKTLLVTLLFLSAHAGFTQDSTTIVVKAGTNVLESVPLEKLYQFPAFTDAIVYYRNGRASRGKLNYFALTDEMQFIGPTGDTIAIANEETISFIAFARDTFFYEKGYLKQISNYQGMKLAQSPAYKIIDRQKKGGYGQSLPASSMTSITTYHDGNRTIRLSTNEDVVLKRSGQYYIGNKLNFFTRAGKSELNKRFAKNHQAIKDYLKEENIDYSKQEDLEKLVRFLSQFSNELSLNN